jgi:hypothetical protein
MKNDSPHITRLVQRAPLELLRPLLTKHADTFGDETLWTDDEKQTRTVLKQAIPGLPDAERQDLNRLCERIDRMTDEAGVEAIVQVREQITDSESFNPANSVKITYEPANGVVEIIARDQNFRPEVFKLFARHVLGQVIEPERVPLRNYTIASLVTERHFTILDPEIASVQVTQLRLRVGARGNSLVLKVGDREQRSIYQLAVDLFGDSNPLDQAYQLDQARIVIKFHRQTGQRRAKSIVIVISMPNGCNIKSHSDRDRQMADKYLRLWGLVEADEGDRGAEPERAKEPAAAL